ncbi:hypothetical protein [Kaistia nematophila]|uniref:Uncharacterized protein n=1 Tax=Kaistia nematophila TaxID=2994654 RepID=A0A9X3ILE6_9HYPH|nr:hypothetical protein [Kaistia nematophila]MCX5570589.1 hypothetical protein [Kaistia nematophila]
MTVISPADQQALAHAADLMSEAWRLLCDAKRLRQPTPRSAVKKVAQVVATALRIANERAHDAALLDALEKWLAEDAAR